MENVKERVTGYLLIPAGLPGVCYVFDIFLVFFEITLEFSRGIMYNSV